MRRGAHAASFNMRRAAGVMERGMRRAACATLVALTTTAAAAQPGGWERGRHAPPVPDFRVQLGLTGGLAQVQADCSGSEPCDRSASAARATAAFVLVPGLALEAQAARFGAIERRIASVDVSEEVRVAGFGLMAPFEIGPATTLELRAGWARVDTAQQRRSAAGSVVNRRLSSSQPTLGMALSYALAPNVGWTLAYDATLAELEGGTRRVAAVTAGLALRF